MHNKKVFRAQDLGSYAQGQDHNLVRSQIVPRIMSSAITYKLLK